MDIDEIAKRFGDLQVAVIQLGRERDKLLGTVINLMVELGKEEIVFEVDDYDFAKDYMVAITPDTTTERVTIQLVQAQDE